MQSVFLFLLLAFCGTSLCDPLSDRFAFLASFNQSDVNERTDIPDITSSFCSIIGGATDFEQLTFLSLVYDQATDMGMVNLSVTIKNPGGVCNAPNPCGNYAAPEYVTIWVDFNRDSTLTPDELIVNVGLIDYLTNDYTLITYSQSFTLPPGAIGLFNVRAILSYSEDITDPCTSTWPFGNFVDTSFTIICHDECLQQSTPNINTGQGFEIVNTSCLQEGLGCVQNTGCKLCETKNFMYGRCPNYVFRCFNLDTTTGNKNPDFCTNRCFALANPNFSTGQGFLVESNDCAGGSSLGCVQQTGCKLCELMSPFLYGACPPCVKSYETSKLGKDSIGENRLLLFHFQH